MIGNLPYYLQHLITQESHPCSLELINTPFLLQPMQPFKDFLMENL